MKYTEDVDFPKVKGIEAGFGKESWMSREYPVRTSNCAHTSCTKCKGTGIDGYGRLCVHALSCSCRNCTTYSMIEG
jgi:hypothetical protein